jgi:uncharacterized membrane protein
LFNYNPNGTDIITENNFVNTTIALWLSNAPVVDRNYWGDYQTRYPNATEIDNTGIGDTPYVYTTVQNGSQTIKYQDNYPLINKLSTLHISTPTPSLSTPSPSPSIPEFSSLIILLFFTVMVMVVGLLVYFKKHKR